MPDDLPITGNRGRSGTVSFDRDAGILEIHIPNNVEFDSPETRSNIITDMRVFVRDYLFGIKTLNGLRIVIDSHKHNGREVIIARPDLVALVMDSVVVPFKNLDLSDNKNVIDITGKTTENLAKELSPLNYALTQKKYITSLSLAGNAISSISQVQAITQCLAGTSIKSLDLRSNDPLITKLPAYAELAQNIEVFPAPEPLVGRKISSPLTLFRSPSGQSNSSGSPRMFPKREISKEFSDRLQKSPSLLDLAEPPSPDKLGKMRREKELLARTLGVATPPVATGNKS